MHFLQAHNTVHTTKIDLCGNYTRHKVCTVHVQQGGTHHFKDNPAERKRFQRKKKKKHTSRRNTKEYPDFAKTSTPRHSAPFLTSGTARMRGLKRGCSLITNRQPAPGAARGLSAPAALRGSEEGNHLNPYSSRILGRGKHRRYRR